MICVSLTTVTLVQAVPPTVTPVAPVKLDPSIVIDVSLSFVPSGGVTDAATGAPTGAAFTVNAASVLTPLWLSGLTTDRKYAPAGRPDGTFARTLVEGESGSCAAWTQRCHAPSRTSW